MALIKRILLFFASLVFTIVLLIGATTGFAKENKTIEFSGETVTDNFRMYDVKWIHEIDKNKKPYVCGTEVKTFDFSGRKYIFSYFLILLNEGNIVSRFIVEAIQISFNNIEPLKTEDLVLKIYGAKMSKDGEDRLGGMRSETSNSKSFDAQFNELDIQRDIEDIKILYKGGYLFHVRMMPGAEIQIPIIENPSYEPQAENVIDSCIADLLKNKEEANETHGEIFEHQAYRVG